MVRYRLSSFLPVVHRLHAMAIEQSTDAERFRRRTRHAPKKHAKSTKERKLRRAQALKRYAQSARGKFAQHKKNAKARGVPFEMTYDEWLDVWIASGHFDERHNKTAEGFVMARNGDRGAYADGNVSIVPLRINTAERNRNFHYAKRAGIPWVWFLNGPPAPPENEIPF